VEVGLTPPPRDRIYRESETEILTGNIVPAGSSESWLSSAAEELRRGLGPRRNCVPDTA
jgi:hypothetical protein